MSHKHVILDIYEQSKHTGINTTTNKQNSSYKFHNLCGSTIVTGVGVGGPELGGPGVDSREDLFGK